MVSKKKRVRAPKKVARTLEQPEAPQEFTLTVNAQEKDAIFAGVMELPGRVCLPIINKLQRQVQAQLTIEG